MATDIDVTYEWWMEAATGLFQYGDVCTVQADAETAFTTPGSMLPDTAHLFKIEHVPVTIGLATVTRRDVTELSLPPR